MLDAEAAAALVAERIAEVRSGDMPPLVGLNGAQGAGKSTLARLVVAKLEARGIRTTLLSLDDFYLTKSDRERLAREVHPLCATRGVPGTHDVALLQATLNSLAAGEETYLPRFDKLADDRLPRAEWPRTPGDAPDIVLLEGWCVGLQSADVPAWEGPINALERECDPHGKWFDWSRAALAKNYDPLWQRVALLVSIEVPGWDTVIESRLRQERGLMDASGRTGMNRAQVVRFAEHYQRYTLALWSAMRKRADLLLRRDADFGYSVANLLA